MTKTYVQTKPELIQVSETHEDGSVATMPLVKAGDDWQKLNGTVVDISDETIAWLDEAAHLAEQQEIEDAATQAAADKAAKLAGTPFKGVNVGLTEANQNGLSALMSAETLAIKNGSTIFPLNFKAETATGYEAVEFIDLAEFESFSLTFIMARQAFF